MKIRAITFHTYEPTDGGGKMLRTRGEPRTFCAWWCLTFGYGIEPGGAGL